MSLCGTVLILVVVEDVLVHINGRMTTDKQGSLNPCCGGRCSSTRQMSRELTDDESLNPCCGGRCSSTRM